jgi:hypothetical protein
MVRGRARQLPLEKENEHGGHERKPDVGWRIELGESEPGADRDEQRLVRGHGAERGFDGRDGRDGERRDRIVRRDGRDGIERKLGSERGGNGRRDGACGAAGQLAG